MPTSVGLYYARKSPTKVGTLNAGNQDRPCARRDQKKEGVLPPELACATV
jgi:hypothetical protein